MTNLPPEISKYVGKITEEELLHFWNKPLTHTGGFSPRQIWESKRSDKRQEIINLIEQDLS